MKHQFLSFSLIKVKKFPSHVNSKRHALSVNVSTLPSGQVVDTWTHTQWVRDAWPYVQTEPAGVNGRTDLNILDTCNTCMHACACTDLGTQPLHKHMQIIHQTIFFPFILIRVTCKSCNSKIFDPEFRFWLISGFEKMCKSPSLGVTYQ